MNETQPPSEPRLYRVAWRSKHTGATGHGQWTTHRDRVDAALRDAEKKWSRDLDHWREEAGGPVPEGNR